MSELTSSKLQGVSVLCIENYIDSLELLRLTLQLEGAEAFAATSSAEALFVMKKSRVDVIVSDLLMPEDNGIELLQKIRATGYEGPAIALTGVSDERVQKNAMDLGFCAYLIKPVDADELVATILKELRRNDKCLLQEAQ